MTRRHIKEQLLPQHECMCCILALLTALMPSAFVIRPYSVLAAASQGLHTACVQLKASPCRNMALIIV